MADPIQLSGDVEDDLRGSSRSGEGCWQRHCVPDILSGGETGLIWIDTAMPAVSRLETWRNRSPASHLSIRQDH